MHEPLEQAPREDLLQSVFGQRWEAPRFWNWKAVLAGIFTAVALLLAIALFVVGAAACWDAANMESLDREHLLAQWYLIGIALPAVATAGMVLGVVAIADRDVRKGYDRGRALAIASLALCPLSCFACTAISLLLTANGQ